MPRRRWWIVGAVVVLVVVGVKVLGDIQLHKRSRAKAMAFRQESVRLLRTLGPSNWDSVASSFTGNQGVIITYEDGSWIALRYGESHAWPGWDMAVLVDSQGRMYASEIHFCGAVKFLKAEVVRRGNPDAQTPVGESSRLVVVSAQEVRSLFDAKMDPLDLKRLLTCQTAEAVAPVLREWGFEAIE